jgi:hypothetical protein
VDTKPAKSERYRTILLFHAEKLVGDNCVKIG